MPVYCSLHHENPDGSAFCDECGEPLAGATPATAAPAVAVAPAPAPAPAPGGQVCPSCGTVNAPGEAFCSNCGVSLLGAPSAQAAVPDQAIAPDATAAPAPAPAPAPVAALAALKARLIVGADNQEFDKSSKDNIVIARED